MSFSLLAPLGAGVRAHRPVCEGPASAPAVRWGCLSYVFRRGDLGFLGSGGSGASSVGSVFLCPGAQVFCLPWWLAFRVFRDLCFVPASLRDFPCHYSGSE